jgi:hypothetical protein
MCDLSPAEKTSILDVLGEIEGVAAKLKGEAATIEERSWMDHEALGHLLDRLAELSAAGRHRVHEKTGAHH